MPTSEISAELERPSLPVVIARSVRPRQWTKNGALLAPLFFARGAKNLDALTQALVAMVAFSLLVSGVYLINDWFDREKDRLHPEKRKRPIAAGWLSLRGASAILAFVWTAAGVLGWWVGRPFVLLMVAYLVLQIAYTFLLKRMVIMDVMAIAMGFILRVMAGAAAIDVTVSNWLFLCTLLLAVFLGFAKRWAELSGLEEGAASHRANLADYSLPLLDQMMSISAASTILSYCLYTVSKETIEHVGNDRLKFTVPCVVYGIFRYLFLVHKRGAGGAPEKVLLGDRALQVDLAVYIAIVGAVLYSP